MANVKCKRVRRGITLIETALVLLMLLMLTLGVIEYGWFFYKSHQIANAARQAARIGARPTSTGSTITSVASGALNDAGIDTNLVDIAYDVAPESIPPGQVFKVTLTADYSSSGNGLSLLNMSMIPTPGFIVSEVTMAREGP